MNAMSFRWLRLVALVAALLVATTFALAEALSSRQAPTQITVHSVPIEGFDVRDPSRQRFGDLEFRGGLELTSSHKAFGGISAIRVAPDGARFIAVSDKGLWLRGRIVYDGKRPAGIAEAEMAPLLGADGKPLAVHGWFDTESIAEDDGTLYVGIERVEQIVRFDYGRDGLLARGRPILVPPDFKTLTYNKSLECLVFVPKGMPLAGTLITVTEGSFDHDGNHRSFLLKGDKVERFSVKRSDEFEVSDCAILPSADLLLLERRFTLMRGAAMRIRRVPLAGIKSGAVVDGRVLIEADLGYQIDNMEGLAVHRTAQGEVVLTLVSDNNFAAIQRNILLQFTLIGE